MNPEPSSPAAAAPIQANAHLATELLQVFALHLRVTGVINILAFIAAIPVSLVALDRMAFRIIFIFVVALGMRVIEFIPLVLHLRARSRGFGLSFVNLFDAVFALGECWFSRIANFSPLPDVDRATLRRELLTSFGRPES